MKGITAAEQSKTLKVKEQEAEIAAAEKKAVLEQKNAEIEEQKLNATIRKKADADRYAAEQQADAQVYRPASMRMRNCIYASRRLRPPNPPPTRTRTRPRSKARLKAPPHRPRAWARRRQSALRARRTTR